MTAPSMPADVAAWIYTNVIASYHWEDWPTMPANEGWPECEPSGMGQESPVPPEVCFCVRRMCTLVGPGRIHRDWSRGYPYRHHFVWLAHARDPIRMAEHARREEEQVPFEEDIQAVPPPASPTPEPEPVPVAGGVQLDIFAEVTA